jgi:hypothetical protein
MSSAVLEKPGSARARGAQRPSTLWLPEDASPAGQEAVELAEMAGLKLDPWEKFVLVNALSEKPNGQWTCFEVGLCVPRQNGKGAILEARELAGLFLLGEPVITHSAHQFDTSMEHFLRLLNLIEETPVLDQRVQRVSRSHGEEGIELKGGQRIRFRTRARGGGRGFTGDLLVLDEAMYLKEAFHGNLLPTLSARSITGNPQVWYTGSAVDQWVHEDGVVFARVRDRGHKGGDESLMWAEWGAEGENPEWVDEEAASDPKVWARSNPGLGIRISPEHIEKERRSMDPRTFAVERLGVGDWPSTDPEEEAVISTAKWKACADPDSKLESRLVFTFDVTPTRSAAAIATAGRRADGKKHIEVVEHGKGTGWVVDRIEELQDRHDPAKIVCDEKSPAASLIPEFEEREIKVETINSAEHAQACGRLFDDVEQGELRHIDQADLNAAVRGAETRPLSDAWAWSRKNSTIDISPLVAATLAAWTVETTMPPGEPLIAWA